MSKPKTPPAAKRAPSKMATALLERADAYATLIGRERSTVSMYLFNDGKVLKSLAEGGDIMTRAFEKAMADLDRRTASLQATAPAVIAPRPKPAFKKPPPKAIAKKATAPKAMLPLPTNTKAIPAYIKAAAPKAAVQAQAATAKSAPRKVAPAKKAVAKSGK